MTILLTSDDGLIDGLAGLRAAWTHFWGGPRGPEHPGDASWAIGALHDHHARETWPHHASPESASKRRALEFARCRHRSRRLRGNSGVHELLDSHVRESA